MFGPKEKGGLAVGMSLFADFLCFAPNLIIFDWIPAYLIIHYVILIILLKMDLFYRTWTMVRFSFIFSIIPLCFACFITVGVFFVSEGIRTDVLIMSGGAWTLFVAVFSLNWWKFSKQKN